MTVKTAYFEITDRCNLNCVTCYNRSGKNVSHSEISLDALKNSIDIFLDYGVSRILISGGEPTLHSQFNQILNLIDSYPNISFGIVTNGTIDNENLADIVNTRPNITLQISLDGSSEEINSLTRGRGNFAKTMEFAKKIHTASHPPYIKMVISQNNINDVENFYHLAVSLNFLPEFAFINHRGNACDGWDNLSLSENQKLSVIRQIDRLNKDTGKNAFIPLCTNGCNYTSESPDISVCVKTNGLIQPCSLLYDSAYALGNIFEFDQTYFEERIRHISSIARQRRTMDYGCDRCILKNNCIRGCMAAALLTNGDVLANDGECNFLKKQLIGFDLKNIASFQRGT